MLLKTLNNFYAKVKVSESATKFEKSPTEICR